MRYSVPILGALFAAVALAGCATGPQGSGVRQGVTTTRFHLGDPIARGEIRVEMADGAVPGSLEQSQQAAAVERELSRLGWRVMRDNPRTEQVALIRVGQGSREGYSSGSSFSFGVGGFSGGYGSGGGVGVGATVPVGSSSNEIVITELGVRIQRRSDATVAWEGRAMLEARAGTPLSGLPEAVDRLAFALFQDFPGESGRTVQVR